MMLVYRFLMLFFLSWSITVSANPAASSTNGVNTILQLTNYVGADYASAVQNGHVIDPQEYIEMTEFSAQIIKLVQSLPENENVSKNALNALANQLSYHVTNKANPQTIYETAHTLSQRLIIAYHVNVTAPKLPAQEHIEKLYKENCASCHGDTGAGNGVMAAHLEPKPTNFHDHLHLDQLSIFALYNTISLGIDETPMPSFQKTFSDEERWGLAFYVASMGIEPQIMEQGKKLWENSPTLRSNLSSDQITSLSVLDLSKKYSHDITPAVRYILKNPDLLQEQKGDLWETTLHYLEASFQSAQGGDYTAAYQEAISAYLEGFEELEPTIGMLNQNTLQNLEEQMLAYRQLLNNKASFQDIQPAFTKLMFDLEKTRHLLKESNVGWINVFFSALIILLREGLEIILVVGLVAAMLIKADRRDALFYVHLGWISAIAAGVATWFISHYFLSISGMQRELTEGVASLLAAAMLFWVGYWLHHNMIHAHWQNFVKKKLGASLSRGSLLGLSSLCFIAVYREMFETVLFYETLWLQVSDINQSALFYGFGTALACLLLVVYLMLHFGVKLPVAIFFRWSSRLLFLMAFIFVGQGLHALDEIGKLPVWSINIPTISLLGIYPNAIGLLAQALLLICAFVLLRNSKTK